jgi:hypothetical protein
MDPIEVDDIDSDDPYPYYSINWPRQEEPGSPSRKQAPDRPRPYITHWWYENCTALQELIILSRLLPAAYICRFSTLN